MIDNTPGKRAFRTRMLVGITIPSALLLATSALADPLPKVEWKYDNGGTLRLYGQINKGVLSYDDGQVQESYGLIDNNNSNTRFGLTYGTDLGSEWSYLGTLEIQYAPFSTSNTSILQPSPPPGAYEFTNANIRKIDNRFASEAFGVFYIGQGDMASQDTAKVDFSGTTVISGVAVQDSAGGQLLRQTDGTLSKIKISNAFKDYNGLGRKVRVRYDTKDINGFVFRTSYGEDQLSSNEAVRNDPLYDIAVAYANEFGDFKFGAQAAYSWADGDTAMVTTLDGSASVLHVPTGLNLTFAAGNQDNESFTGSYYYLKAGWLGDVVSWGKTAVAVDYYDGSDIQSVGSESTSSSISLVQNITNANTELWLTYREYEFDTPTQDYDSASAFFVGARFKF